MISSRAREYVRSRIIRDMTFTVQVERVTRATYDEDTLVGSPGTRTELYTGPARIWEVQGGNTVVIGEADVDIPSTQISFPHDTELFRKDDEVIVIASTHDPAMVGKRYQLQSSAKAGELRPTRRYTATAVN